IALLILAMSRAQGAYLIAVVLPLLALGKPRRIPAVAVALIASLPALDACSSSCGVAITPVACWSAEAAAGDGRPAIFCSNASSTSLALAATRVFLAGRALLAQMTAASADARVGISATSLLCSPACVGSSSSTLLPPRREPFLE